MNAKKKALGKGLGALLENPDTDITTKGVESGKYVAGSVAEIPINSIEANPFQPRSEFAEEGLQELAQSITEQGVIQPLTVRKVGYEKYQLISGERRLRASKLAGLERVPSFIRIADDQQMLEMSLVENIQRRDLNAIEVAISYQRLMEECSLTQEKLSSRVGKKRSTITNYLRLLKLPPDVQIALRDGTISMGHARTLINVEDEEVQLDILKEITENALSVREVEQIVKNINSERPENSGAKQKSKQQNQLPEKYQHEAERLTEKLGKKVAMKRNPKGKGTISISFSSDEELENLIEALNKLHS
ncbi:MAG: ParB/RepB/Spo0J family partition protein [Bacteroidales bacterium]|nr:ParB/RepB/Spo0J family partition protein [Bacteroidales bacterium]MCF8328659.1 ParB/RepB/Spo0J family partition protein [Bacteroidales bacterium]